MKYHFMEDITSPIRDKVLRFTKDCTFENCTENDVKKALSKDTLTFDDYATLLSPTAENFLEVLANRAKIETRKHFGNSISFYTPLYISNYCTNHCIYCGFHSKNEINRGKLSFQEIENEFKAICKTGLREILLLTGEDRENSDIEYIAEAIRLAKKYFSTIGIEIYPLNTDEYSYLNQNGADFVSVYQETYDIALYDQIHISGPKKDYCYRFDAQERAIKSGMRGVSFGVLFGLGDFRKDAFATGLHAYFLQQKYPHAEISFSVPRLRACNNSSDVTVVDTNKKISERQLLQVMLAHRIFMPFASISISTRERADFRDNVVGIAATKISAEVKTCVGGHFQKKGDEQFEVSDSRDVSQIHDALIKKGLQPVYVDYIRQ